MKQPAAVLGGGQGEDTPVDPHVADLRLVGDAAQRDDGPVLELERRDPPQLLLGPQQVAQPALEGRGAGANGC